MKIDENELEKIFLNIKQDRTSGIEELYCKYKKVIYGIVFTIAKNQNDAEDIAQTIFVKMTEMEDSKLPKSNYASWLYVITKNETINFLKKKKKDIPLDKIYEIPDESNEINKIIDNEEFNKLISKLNDKEKEIISLKILSNFSFEEIGKLLKEPTGTVKWRYYKSMNSLKIILENIVMSIVSFIIGVKALFTSNQGKNVIEQENSADLNISDEDILQDNLEANKGENINNTITNTTPNENSTIQENIIYENEMNNNYNQFIGYSFIGLSIIFLIISLCFLIKYQLKRIRKLSK